MRSVNAFAYSLHKVGGKQTETAGDSGLFLCNCPSVGLSLSRAPIPALLALLCNSTLEWSQGEGNSVVRNRAAQTIPGMASEQWRGRHYWHLWRQSIQNSLELWLGPGPPQLLPWPTLNTCSSPSCSSSLTSGGKGPMLREGNGIYSGTKPTQPNLNDFCFSNLGPGFAPSWVVLATEQRRNPGSGSSPSIFRPCPTKVIAASIPCGKM